MEVKLLISKAERLKSESDLILFKRELAMWLYALSRQSRYLYESPREKKLKKDYSDLCFVRERILSQTPKSFSEKIKEYLDEGESILKSIISDVGYTADQKTIPYIVSHIKYGDLPKDLSVTTDGPLEEFVQIYRREHKILDENRGLIEKLQESRLSDDILRVVRQKRLIKRKDLKIIFGAYPRVLNKILHLLKNHNIIDEIGGSGGSVIRYNPAADNFVEVYMRGVHIPPKLSPLESSLLKHFLDAGPISLYSLVDKCFEKEEIGLMNKYRQSKSDLYKQLDALVRKGVFNRTKFEDGEETDYWLAEGKQIVDDVLPMDSTERLKRGDQMTIDEILSSMGTPVFKMRQLKDTRIKVRRELKEVIGGLVHRGCVNIIDLDHRHSNTYETTVKGEIILSCFQTGGTVDFIEFLKHYKKYSGYPMKEEFERYRKQH